MQPLGGSALSQRGGARLRRYIELSGLTVSVLWAPERTLWKIEVASTCTPRRGVRSREGLRNP